MSLPIRDILGILSDNLRLRKSVMPLSRRRRTAWARGLDIPFGGKTVLYTGQMYQLMPAVASLEKMMAGIEGTWLAKTMGAGRWINKWVNTSGLMSRPDARKQESFDRRLRNIALLLRDTGVEFGYLYEKELYTGALVFDQGITDVFRRHARKVHAVLKKAGVRNVITVDPHTTDIFRNVYPNIIEGFDIGIKSYLEVLVEKGLPAGRSLDRDVVLHDSCVYARYMDVIDQPRELLKKAGAVLHEQDASRKMTQCCGGPVESLFLKKAQSLARERIQQLTASGCKNVITMCPICLLNLQSAPAENGATVCDISEVLSEACQKSE